MMTGIVPGALPQHRFLDVSASSTRTSYGGVLLPRSRPELRARSNVPSTEAKRLEPLPKEDLVNYLKSGCRPKSEWRC